MHSHKVVTADGKVKGTKEKNSATTSTESNGAELSEKKKNVMTENAKQFVDRSLRGRISGGEVDRLTAVIDETDDEQLFAVGAVITDDPESFAKISRDIRRGAELKYRGTGRTTKEYMERKITEHGAEVLGVHADMREIPMWWRIAESKADRHQKMLMDLSEDLLDLNIDFDKIIVDQNNRTLKDDAGAEIVRAYVEEVRKYNYIGQENSESGDNKDLMQTADFAIGAMGRKLRGREPETTIRITSRTRRKR